MVEATRTEGSVATLAEAMATVQVPEDSEVVAWVATIILVSIRAEDMAETKTLAMAVSSLAMAMQVDMVVTQAEGLTPI